MKTQQRSLKFAVITLVAIVAVASALGQAVETDKKADKKASPKPRTVVYKKYMNIPYRSEQEIAADPSEAKGCLADIYIPEGASTFTTVVWFHGGGLSSGDKDFYDAMSDPDIAYVSVRYRLLPHVKAATCIDDAAAATAWVFKNIKRYGGDPDNIVVSGHSAGGYLSAMIGLDKNWLLKYGVDANKLRAIVPLSGQMITHMAVRGERGIPVNVPVIDEFAPLYHVRVDAPPIFLITGDRELEYCGRYEENAYMTRMLNISGHKNTALHEIKTRDHGGMLGEGLTMLTKYIAAGMKKP